MNTLDINSIREQFPILSRKIYDKYPLVYLDNAATTQKPRLVVESMSEEYYNVNANVHRGVHFLSQQATDLHEAARERVRTFLNARSTSEIVFTRGTTESINLVATSLSRMKGIAGNPEIIVSSLEHHSNIVSWQLAGFRLCVIPMDDDGGLDMEAYRHLFTERTCLVSVTHVSNVLGVETPVSDLVRIAHEHNVPILIDGAQSAPHRTIDVQALDCDFFALSGHKMYGPTGIGVLYGKETWLDRLPPYMGGGEMIKNVSFEHTTFNALPYKFEAGTPDYIATTGLARAIDFIEGIGMDALRAHEEDLTRYAVERLSGIEGMHIYGYNPSTGQMPHGVISFQLGNIHHLDMGTLLDRLGIAVRTGHHCAEPLMHRLGIEGTCRASFALYNTRDEVDRLASAIERIKSMF
ncbi:MAG: cysteine desulfurase [Bacteroidaceae bacterium]|nr:cysteine desulfurase [Bacteroidaceae bacterium]